MYEGKTSVVGMKGEQDMIDFADLPLSERAKLATVSVSRGVGAAALEGEIGIYTEGTESDVHAVPGDVTASDPSWDSRGMGNIYHPDKPQGWTQPELDIFGTDASAEEQDGQISDETPSIDPKTWDYRYPEAGPEDGELLRGDDE
jgi:hypothetical protein